MQANSRMSAETTCPNCGTTTSAGALGGLCLRCLGRLGFAADVDDAAGAGLLRLGDYELLEEIARGGMGVVYRARQLSLNRIVAVKVVLHGPFASPDFVRRFRTEAEAAAALRHPNIVSIYEIGERDGHHFLSMEFVEGQNFAEIVREKPLPARVAAGHLKTIAEAVQHAHERGILHRDLKPSNVLLDALGQPRITDFGLAKLLHNGEEITLTGQVLGSPNHMPPEQAMGKRSTATPQADVYSLGAILYQLLTCRPPFQGETLQEILLQVQTVEPVAPRRLNPSVPPDLQTMCLKCLQKETAQRYASAQELADDLGRFLANKPIRARPVPPVERVWLWCKRRPVVAAMSGALLLAVLLGLGGIFWQWRRAEANAQGELKQRIVAENLAARTRLNLYAADVALAAEEIHDNNFGLARQRLDALRARPGETDLRGFEWRYLWNLCRGSELASLTGHEWIVTCAAFSPDGKSLVTGSMDGTVRVWDPARQRSVQTLAMSTGAVMTVAFTPDGSELMMGGVAGVEMRSTGSWQILTNFPARLASLSKEGTLMATADSSQFYYEHAGAVTLWNWRTGAMLRRMADQGRAVALSPDGRRLAMANVANGVNLFDTDSGQLLRVLPTKNPVWSLNFSPDGRRLVTVGWSSDPLVWSLADASPPHVLPGHRLTVWSAEFSPDGKVLATTGSDQSIRLWDAESFEALAVLRGHSSEVWCAAFSPDGQVLASGGKDRSVKLWSTKARSSQNFLPHENFERPVFSPDGTKIITVKPGTEANSQLWRIADRALLTPAFAGGTEAPGFSRDGQFVIVFESETPALEFWSLEGVDSGRRVVLQGAATMQRPLLRWGMSPEAAYFFAVDRAGAIRIWDAESGRLVRELRGPAPPLRNIVLGPQAKKLAVCVERENFARLCDCNSGREILLQGHRDFVSGLAFSRDGKLLATGSMDGTIRLWETADGQLSAALPGHMEETTDVAFSPDGNTLASLGHGESFKLWHLPTRREVYSETLPDAGIYLQFSPDGHWLAVMTDQQKLRLYGAPAD